MKNFLLFPSALALGLGLVSANAAPISHAVTLNATVNSGCTVGAPSGPGFTVSGASSTFATTVNGTTSVPASGTLTFGDIVCTTPRVRVTLASARIGLYVTGTEGNTNNKRMNYQAIARLNTTILTTLNTLQGVASQNGQSAVLPSGSGTNNISVEISFPGAPNELLPNGALIAGVYSDTLTITIDGTTV